MLVECSASISASALPNEGTNWRDHDMRKLLHSGLCAHLFASLRESKCVGGASVFKSVCVMPSEPSLL